MYLGVYVSAALQVADVSTPRMHHSRVPYSGSLPSALSRMKMQFWSLRMDEQQGSVGCQALSGSLVSVQANACTAAASQTLSPSLSCH